MNNLNDFLDIVSKGKKEISPKNPKINNIQEKIKNNSFLSLLESEIIESKKIEKVENKKGSELFSFFESIPVSLNSFVEEEIVELIPESIEQEVIAEEIIQEEIVELIPESIEQEVIEEEIIIETPKILDLTDGTQYDKLFKTKVDLFNEPNLPKVNPEMKALTDKIQYMENWLSKIAAAGPGGGEVNLRWLDDVYRPSIYDGRFLRYNDTIKKFEFAEVNPHDIVYTTRLIDTPIYIVDGDEYYMGVNYAGPVTITLPLAPSSGRMLIIKDESGNASTNPITVLGTVDNDTGGFIIQLDNGGIQMIYRNGWRIV